MADDTCTLDGCEKRHYRRGWCSMHFQRVQKTGEPGPIGSHRLLVHEDKCTIDGCDRPYKAKGKCDMHIRRLRKNGDLGPAETLRRRNAGLCAADDCRNFSRSAGLCPGHYRQHQDGRPITSLDTQKSDWRGKSLERDEHGNKQCRRCLDWFSLSSFSKNKRTADGYAQYCPACVSTYSMRTLYGITPEEYDRRLAEQGGGCAICGTADPGRGSKRFFIDHDHECCATTTCCGKCVRGLLCSGCNLGLGQFGDDASRLVAAAKYLRGSK